MKLFLKTLPILLYPYLYMFCLAGYFFVSSLELVSGSEIILFVFLAASVLCSLLALIIGIAFIAGAATGKYSAKALTKLNMVIKFAHIPAYLAHFVLGIIGLLMSVWGIPLVLWSLLIDLLTIGISGLVGVSAAVGCRKAGCITGGRCVLCSIFSFVYCADVVTAPILYVCLKRQNAAVTKTGITPGA